MQHVRHGHAPIHVLALDWCLSHRHTSNRDGPHVRDAGMGPRRRLTSVCGCPRLAPGSVRVHDPLRNGLEESMGAWGDGPFDMTPLPTGVASSTTTIRLSGRRWFVSR